MKKKQTNKQTNKIEQNLRFYKHRRIRGLNYRDSRDRHARANCGGPLITPPGYYFRKVRKNARRLSSRSPPPLTLSRRRQNPCSVRERGSTFPLARRRKCSLMIFFVDRQGPRDGGEGGEERAGWRARRFLRASDSPGKRSLSDLRRVLHLPRFVPLFFFA